MNYQTLQVQTTIRQATLVVLQNGAVPAPVPVANSEGTGTTKYTTLSLRNASSVKDHVGLCSFVTSRRVLLYI